MPITSPRPLTALPAAGDVRKKPSRSPSLYNFVSCLNESLNRRLAACNVVLPLVLCPCVLAPLPLAAVLPAAERDVTLPAVFEDLCCICALFSQCKFACILLITLLVRSISSLTRWLSLIIIMLVRPSNSSSALLMRDTSSRRDSCSVSR